MKKIGLKSVVAALILAIVAFVFVIFVETKMMADYEKTDAVIAIKDIPAYTQITSKNITEYFKVEQIPKDMKMSGAYSQIDDIKEVIIEKDMEAGEQITKKKLISVENNILIEYDDPVVLSIRCEHLSNAVSGTLKKGDIVDIVAVNVMDDETETLKEDVYILGSYDTSGNEMIIDDTGSNTAVVFNVLCERSEYESLLLETSRNNCVIKLVKVNNIK